MGLVGSMGMTGNMLLKSYGNGPSPITDMRAPKKMAEKVKKELEVVTPSLNTPVSRLSGGNVQKVLVGREIAGGTDCPDDCLCSTWSGYQYLPCNL